MDGLTKRIPVHLRRGATETVDPEIMQFYHRLLPCLRHPSAQGEWQLLECTPAWDGNWTWDCFVCFAWQAADQESLIVVVNYSPNQSQCYLPLPFDKLKGKAAHLRDLMGTQEYDREGDEILSCGLYLDLPAGGYHIFELRIS
jgi:hypothetical protein